MLFRKAILIIHGFAGGTYDIENLSNYLELNRNFDVFTFTLPGHDKSLGKAKCEDWIMKSEDEIKWLISNGYNKIYLIGHSMGGVIATYLASKYKEVKKLVLGAPAFHYFNIEDNTIDISETIKSIPKLVNNYGKDELISRFLKLNITTLKEFMSLVKIYYDYPKQIKCPILILQGKCDDIVPISSSKYVYSSVKSNIKKLVFIDNETHDLFKGENKEEIYKIIEEFLIKRVEGGIIND